MSKVMINLFCIMVLVSSPSEFLILSEETSRQFRRNIGRTMRKERRVAKSGQWSVDWIEDLRAHLRRPTSIDDLLSPPTHE